MKKYTNLLLANLFVYGSFLGLWELSNWVNRGFYNYEQSAFTWVTVMPLVWGLWWGICLFLLFYFTKGESKKERWLCFALNGAIPLVAICYYYLGPSVTGGMQTPFNALFYSGSALIFCTSVLTAQLLQLLFYKREQTAGNE